MWPRLVLMVLMLMAISAFASDAEPEAYSPGRVVYDLSSPDPAALQHVLDRASALQNLYGSDPFEASIVIVVHEGAIPSFSNRNAADPTILQRAASLALGEVIQFRLCRMSAQMQGYEQKDFPEFASLVPMADAEIVRLQQAGYAYLQ